MLYCLNVMEKKYLTLNDISVYKRAFSLSNYIWKIVLRWDFFAKDTIGKQYVRAIDQFRQTSRRVLEGMEKKIKLCFIDIVLDP